MNTVRIPIPMLPSATDYWGAGFFRPVQPTAPAVVVPETDNRASLPSISTGEVRNGWRFILGLVVVVFVGVMAAHWVEREL